jgi:hypothetical protein
MVELFIIINMNRIINSNTRSLVHNHQLYSNTVPALYSQRNFSMFGRFFGGKEEGKEENIK